MSQRRPSDPATLEVVILMGLQGAGKSTFCERRFAATHVVVSRDAFRNNRRPSRRQAQLLEEALLDGSSVVVDNTSVTRAQRAEIVEVARRHEARVVGYYVSCSVQRALERNARREGKAKVAEVAIFSAVKLLERPSRDEGFDDLFFVENRDDEGFVVQPYRDESDHGAE